MKKWNLISPKTSQMSLKSLIIAGLLCSLTTPAVANQCLSRSGTIDNCEHAVFKVAEFFDKQGISNKKMVCFCQSDFSFLTKQGDSRALRLQQQLEVEMWASRFELTTDEFKRLLRP